MTLAPDAKEEVILDVNALGEGKSHCDIRAVKPSPDHTLVAYAADFTGNETYSISVLDLATGKLVRLPNTRLVFLDSFFSVFLLSVVLAPRAATAHSSDHQNLNLPS